jgi:hypothetical protein
MRHIKLPTLSLPAIFRVAFVGMVVATPLPAFAYIDPGTGSMLVQSLLAAIAMAVGGIGVFFGRIRAFVSKFRAGDKNETRD